MVDRGCIKKEDNDILDPYYLKIFLLFESWFQDLSEKPNIFML